MGRRGARRASLELLGLVVGVEFLLWGAPLPGFAFLRIAVGLAVAVLLFASWRAHGWRAPIATPALGMLPSWGKTAVATMASALLVLALSRALGWWGDVPLHFDSAAFGSWGDLRWWLGKLVAVSVQQLLLQLCVLPLCFQIARTRGRALLLAGLVFGAVHLPNPVLSLLTALAAPIWCALYLRTGRVAPLLASHVVLAILVRGSCGDAIYNMRVGASVLPLLPHEIVASDGSKLRVTPRSLEGFLDECVVRGEVAVCRGWSADVDRRRASEGVMVLAGGSWHREVPARTARPDVAARLGIPGVRESGFEIEMPMDWFQAGEEPRFFGFSGDQMAELQYHSGQRLE